MMEALGDAPPVSVQSLVTEVSIIKALRELLPTMDAETATLKLVMQKLAVRFGMEFRDLKAQWRPHIKAVLPEMLDQCLRGEASEEEGEKDKHRAEEEEEVDLRPNRKRTTRKHNAVVDASDEEAEEDTASDNDASGGEEANPEEDDEEEEDDIAPAKKRLKASNNGHSSWRSSKSDGPPVKKAKTVKQQDPPGLASLKELGRAAGVMNPRLYRFLNGATSTEDSEEILRKRLQDAGVAFNGTYPSSRDISAAKRKHDKAKELEGIDTNLIISGGRSRRGGSQHISYKEERISGEEDNAEEEEDEDDKDAEEFGGSDSDSSEASF
ncbi:hypothetical protein KRP22_010857 [Phytophthora ramorum]|nr:hypothetical protein KRP22_5271 [Phytophthora ramorum]